MRYWPASFVVTDRTFSISDGLDASTPTPGSTAPDVSRATPVIDACAYSSEGMRRTPREAHAVFSRCIRPPERDAGWTGESGGRIIARVPCFGGVWRRAWWPR